MSTLLKEKCIPCEGGVAPLNKEEVEGYLFEIFEWEVDKEYKKISKTYKFSDFIGAINFVERIADVAEMEGHHPDIHIYYNKVLIELYTHTINGLSKNDFILAAKIEEIR
jgi:4a-hydroxytetrahydrobiopterin dehydratase